MTESFISPSKKAIRDLDLSIKALFQDQSKLLDEAGRLAIELGKLRASRILLQWGEIVSEVEPSEPDVIQLAERLKK